MKPLFELHVGFYRHFYCHNLLRKLFLLFIWAGTTFVTGGAKSSLRRNARQITPVLSANLCAIRVPKVPPPPPKKKKKKKKTSKFG